MKDYVEFNKAKAIARKNINKKKKQNFISFIESINKFSMKYIWNKIKILKHAFRNGLE